MKKNIMALLAILIILLVVIFTVLNVASVPINLGVMIIKLPLALIIWGSILIGILIDFVISASSFFKYHKKSRQLKSSKKRVK